MLKHFCSCGIVAVLLLSSAAVAFADTWDGTVDVSCDLTQPTISINSAAQLAYVAQQSAATDFSGKTIVLTADLDLNNHRGHLSDRKPSRLPARLMAQVIRLPM